MCSFKWSCTRHITLHMLPADDLSGIHTFAISNKLWSHRSNKGPGHLLRDCRTNLKRHQRLISCIIRSAQLLSRLSDSNKDPQVRFCTSRDHVTRNPDAIYSHVCNLLGEREPLGPSCRAAAGAGSRPKDAHQHVCATKLEATLHGKHMYPGGVGNRTHINTCYAIRVKYTAR
jgi:hypothetical protein